MRRNAISINPFPFLSWLKVYDKDKLHRDLVAGLTVATVLVPQSMAYALLAGMPPIYGLYASFLPVIVASLFGSSRFLATGPVAMTALLTGSALYGLAEAGSERWVALAAILAIMVGFIRLFIGLFKFAFILDLVSSSVIVGFVSAGEFVISLSQVGYILGFKVTQSTRIYEVIADILNKISHINPYTIAVGALAFFIIWLSRKISPLLPGPLIAVIITSLISYFFNLNNFGVSIVGNVPKGIPSLELPSVDYRTFSQLWVGALVIAFFGLIEAVAIARQLAIRTGDKWDANQELIGQGLANIVAGLFKGFPVGGSFSRSAMNFQLGAKTPMAGVITGLTVGLTLLFVAPLFYYLPKATLATIVLFVIINSARPQRIIELYRINPMDGIVAGVTFISIFFIDLLTAIVIGTILSLGSFLYKTMYPRIVILTRNPRTSTFVNAEREGLPECPQILYIRPNMSIYFGNAEYVYEYTLNKVEERKKSLKFVLLDFEAVNHIDATGSLMLTRLIDKIRSMGIEVSIANISCALYPLLERVDIDRHINIDYVFYSKGQSITELFKRIDHEYCRKKCPYAVFNECWTVKEKDFKPMEKGTY